MKEKEKTKRSGQKVLITVCTITAIFIVNIIIVNRYKSNKYQRAVELMNEGSIVEAYAVLSELKGYQDSKERMYSIRKQYPAVCFAAVKEGDTVFFGRFEQDGNLTNGAEEIEWIVLEHRADRVLLLSRFVLVPMPFHDEYTEISWKDCSLRAWLNGEFLEKSFSKIERELIWTVENKNKGNEVFESAGCVPTKDQLYIFSLDEASAYFHTDEQKYMIGSADATPYAINQNIKNSEDNDEKVAWWLRTPGVYEFTAAFVDSDGNLYPNGAVVNNDMSYGVRPALWIDIKPSDIK